MDRETALVETAAYLKTRFERVWQGSASPQTTPALCTNASPGVGKTFFLSNLADVDTRAKLIDDIIKPNWPRVESTANNQTKKFNEVLLKASKPSLTSSRIEHHNNSANLNDFLNHFKKMYPVAVTFNHDTPLGDCRSFSDEVAQRIIFR